MSSGAKGQVKRLPPAGAGKPLYCIVNVVDMSLMGVLGATQDQWCDINIASDRYSARVALLDLKKSELFRITYY